MADPGEATSPAHSSCFASGRAYELHPQVALRREPFGALAYHYGNRRLTFVRSTRLVELVERLGEHASATEALDALELCEEGRQSMERALAALERGDVIRAR